MQRGKGRVPVADYSLTAQALPDYAEVSSQTAMHASHAQIDTPGAGSEVDKPSVTQQPQLERPGKTQGSHVTGCPHKLHFPSCLSRLLLCSCSVFAYVPPSLLSPSLFASLVAVLC